VKEPNAKISVAVMNVNVYLDSNPMAMEDVKMSMNVKLNSLTIAQSIPNVIILLEHMNVNVPLDTNHLAINVLTSTNANSMFVIQMHHAPIPWEDLSVNVTLATLVMV